MINKTTLIAFLPILLPSLALAQPEDFYGLVDSLIGILKALVPLVVALTVLVVLWAGAKMVLNSDDPQKLSEGRQILMWGIVVLFIMVSVWGLVNILGSVLLI